MKNKFLRSMSLGLSVLAITAVTGAFSTASSFMPMSAVKAEAATYSVYEYTQTEKIYGIPVAKCTWCETFSGKRVYLPNNAVITSRTEGRIISNQMLSDGAWLELTRYTITYKA